MSWSYELLFNKQLQDDALDFLARCERERVAADAIVFDPQYRSVLTKMAYGNEGARQKGRATMVAMTEEYIAACIMTAAACLKPSGHLFLWADKFIVGEGRHAQFVSPALHLVDFIVWNKLRMGMGYRSRRLGEYCMVYQKEPKRAKGVWTSHSIPDVWPEKLPGKKQPGHSPHPHRKPAGLMGALLAATVPLGGLVLDPAAGSFLTLEICRAQGLRFLGCDIEG